MGFKILNCYETFEMSSCLCYIFSCFLSLAAHFHPVHVSVLNAELTREKTSLQLSFKVFTSDLELAIAHNYNVALNLGKPNEKPDAMNYISKYFSGAFSIKLNNNLKQDLVFVKKTINEDAIWLTYNVSLKKTINELDINNMVLMDIYMDQVNLMILVSNGKETGYRFSFDHPNTKIKI